MQVSSLETSTHRAQLTASAIAHAAFVPTGLITVLLGPLLPTLSARWSLNDSQAGYLVTAQFLGALLSTVSCGVVLPRFGFRRTISGGLVPVACPFLLAAFQHRGHTNFFLYGIAGLLAVATVILLVISTDLPEPRREADSAPWRSSMRYLWTPSAVVLGAIFFIYVGTENALGAWLASYAKRVSAIPSSGWITVPSYFYGALLFGRVLAPLTLREVSDLKQACTGAVLAMIGSGTLLFARSVSSVAVCAILAGLGMSSLYPIAIGFLSEAFGAATPRIAGVMFALSTLGGASVPWLVGYLSTQFASLRTALVVAVAGCLAMLLLFRSSNLHKSIFEQGR